MFELDDCENQVYFHMITPVFEGYNPVEACSRVTRKPFQNAVKLTFNQLTLPCKVLHNIIAHVIVP